MDSTNKNVWIVVGVVILLLLAFLAFGRGAADKAVNNTQQAATTTAQAMDRTAVRAQAVADLTALRAREQAGETYDSLKDQYAAVRARLAASYENADEAGKQEWAAISANFDEFEAQARAGTGNFLDTLSNLIKKLSVNVQAGASAQ
ncbi:MAG: hypothetical protein JWN64_600 [Parcubacteria group bacterium]|nr:hypothetical protein [Parcubacteria group bacterium]